MERGCRPCNAGTPGRFRLHPRPRLLRSARILGRGVVAKNEGLAGFARQAFIFPGLLAMAASQALTLRKLRASRIVDIWTTPVLLLWAGLSTKAQLEWRLLSNR